MYKVAVLGASNKPERYSYKAIKMLADKGHQPMPISRDGAEILGYSGSTMLKGTSPDIVTVYLSSQNLDPLLEDLIEAKPQRVIFNPGAEAPEVYEQLEKAGIRVQEACTLVLLSTGQL
jgi:uncharacterized protein